jgi:hypothetical protein
MITAPPLIGIHRLAIKAPTGDFGSCIMAGLIILFDADSNLGVSLGETVISRVYTVFSYPLSSSLWTRRMFSGATKVMSVAVDSNNCRPVTRDEFRTQDPLSMFLLPTEIPYIVLRSVSVTHVFTDVAYIQFQMSKFLPRFALARVI